MTAAERSPVDAAISRCPSCGRRVRARDPGCPIHGPIAGDPGDDPEPSAPSFASLPSFPGYRTVRVLGRGGFGIVLGAEPSAGGERVAIKLARSDRPDAGARLLEEVAALRAVGPPHVPEVFAQGTLATGEPYVVMEHLGGAHLGERLLAGSMRLSLHEACALAVAILDALAAIHEKGFVHRDLKPENLLIDERGRVTIVDFGLVTRSVSGDGGPDLTEAGAAVGTADYMSPEQCEGEVTADARADLYAVGVILYELIAERPPFWGPAARVHQDHLSRRPPRLSVLAPDRDVPPALDDLALRCLAKDRRDRFESAAALRDAILGVLGERSASRSSRPAAPIERSPARGKRTSSRDERRTLGLLFFTSPRDAIALGEALGALGGELAHVDAGRYVVAYGLGHGDNPARLALAAARGLLHEGIAERVHLDLGAVSIQTRKDGSKRFLSPTFTRSERFPQGDGPLGLTFSPAVVAVLPELDEPEEPPPSSNLTFELLDQTQPMSLDLGVAPLLGRNEILSAAIASARTAARDGAPTVAVFLGAAGHGKSHLATVLGRRLADLGPLADVIELRAREPIFGGADQTLRELLRRVLDLPVDPPRDGEAALLRARLGVLATANGTAVVARALGWSVAATEAPSWPGLRTLDDAPGAVRAALTLVTAEAIRLRAAQRPVVLLLDDAHFAGDVVLGALEHAAVAEARARLWIGVLARPSFAADRPTWGDGAAMREEHRLGPLDPGSAAVLCRWLLQPVEAVPESVIQRLIGRAEGSPLLLVELVRGLKREEIVRKNPMGDGWYLATDELDRLRDLPLIEWLSHGELDALSPALRAHARLLALLGEDVNLAEMTGVLHRLELQGGETELPLDPKIAVHRLLAAGIVIKGRRGQLGFRHDLARVAVARSAPEAWRRKIHFAAADYYGDPASSPDDRRLAQLAYHAAEVGMGPVAAGAYLELAERARLRHAYADAERLYSRSLEQPGERDPSARSEAYRARGRMRTRIGRYHDALTDFSCAREVASGDGDLVAQAAVLLDEATTLDWMDLRASAAERVEEAATLLPEPVPPLLGARLLLGRGRAAHRLGRAHEAVRWIERAAIDAGKLGEPASETVVAALLLLGEIHPRLDRLMDAGVAIDSAIVLCEEHGDAFHLGSAFHHRGVLAALRGDEDAMVADLARCLSTARALGQTTLERMVEHSRAEQLFLRDDLEAAEPHLRRALAIDRRLAGGEARLGTALLDARFASYAGRFADAAAILVSIGDRRQSASAEGRADAALSPAEEVLLAMVELSLAGGSELAWDELEARAAQSSSGQERIEVIEGRALAALRRGRREEARAALRRAVALAEAVPNRMSVRLRRLIAAVDGPSTPVADAALG